MGTTFPPIGKGAQATTNPLPDSDDELVEITKYEFDIRVVKKDLDYGRMYRGRLSNLADELVEISKYVFNMALANKASPTPSKSDLVVDDAAEYHTLNAIWVSQVVDVAAVEAILGYTFQDKALLEAALTHMSSTFSYLALMGDKAISLVVTRRLLSKSDDSLTRLHSLNVDNEKLARAAVAHGLHRFLRHEVPSFQRHVDDFAKEIAGYPLHSNGQAWTPKLLSDIVESLIGAVYIDSNDTEQVWQVFQRLADPLIGPEAMAVIGMQPMTEFNELNHQMRVKAKIDTKEWAKNGAVKVVLAGETIGSATYRKSKDIAKNRAVKSALDMIKQKIACRAKFPSQLWRKN